MPLLFWLFIFQPVTEFPTYELWDHHHEKNVSTKRPEA